MYVLVRAYICMPAGGMFRGLQNLISGSVRSPSDTEDAYQWAALHIESTGFGGARPSAAGSGQISVGPVRQDSTPRRPALPRAPSCRKSQRLPGHVLRRRYQCPGVGGLVQIPCTGVLTGTVRTRNLRKGRDHYVKYTPVVASHRCPRAARWETRCWRSSILS